MKQKVAIGLFLFIFVIGIVLRFYQLGSIPASLNWDEVSWGYNAYSISQTGRDEHGEFLPLSFKAFGDYKQPLYIYLDVIPVMLFGLTGFATRFPSAFFGSLSILSVFLLTRELFYKRKEKTILAFLIMALFALSPWSIQFSRVAFEANVGIFFTITGAWMFLRAVRMENRYWLFASVIVMSLSCYTYHSQKLFTPFLFLALLFYTRTYFLKYKKLAILLLAVFFLVNSFWLVDSRTTARGRSVVFTSHQTEILQNSTQKIIEDRKDQDLLGQLLHNRRLVYLKKYIENYTLHFDPNFLFITGDNPRHHPPFMGVLYLGSLPFILLGLINLLKKYKKESILIVAWLLLAPVASSLAVDAPNASRSLVFLPTWQIVTGIGIFSSVELFVHRKRQVMVFSTAILYALSVFLFVHNYFSHTDTTASASWQYGYKEAVEFASSIKPPAKTFFAQDVEQPYIFYLFHTKKNPADYIKLGGSARITNRCYTIDNSYFGNCIRQIKQNDYLISQFEEVPVQAREISEIRLPNGDVALNVYRAL